MELRPSQNQPHPQVLRMNGDIVPKCKSCFRDSMKMEVIDKKTVLATFHWCLQFFIEYKAEFEHKCQFRTRLQEQQLQVTELMEGNANLRAKLDEYVSHQPSVDSLLEFEPDNVESALKDEQLLLNADSITLKKDVRTYKQASLHWKKEANKLSRQVSRLNNVYVSLLRKFDSSTMKACNTEKSLMDEIEELKSRVKFPLKSRPLTPVECSECKAKELKINSGKKRIFEQDKKIKILVSEKSDVEEQLRVAIEEINKLVMFVCEFVLLSSCE